MPRLATSLVMLLFAAAATAEPIKLDLSDFKLTPAFKGGDDLLKYDNDKYQLRKLDNMGHEAGEVYVAGWDADSGNLCLGGDGSYYFISTDSKQPGEEDRFTHRHPGRDARTPPGQRRRDH